MDLLKPKKHHGKLKIEPPNGLKADQRLRRYKDLIEKDKERCLGSYCFLWGQKQESTATWHGMFLSNGNPTEAVDVMHFCWKGEWPHSRAPSIKRYFIARYWMEKRPYFSPFNTSNFEN